MPMIVRRQWTSRLRSACMAAGQTRSVLEGRSPVSKSATGQTDKTGLSLVDVYRQRLARYQAEILICRAAIHAIDSEQGNHSQRQHSVVQVDTAAHPEESVKSLRSGTQGNLF